jgi:glycosyltransferase involved in cell wall biosynthesis
MKKSSLLIHIIPTLQNGGAETMLARIIEEFYKLKIKQYVFTINGNDNDFHFRSIIPFCEIIHLNKNKSKAFKILESNQNSTLIGWMYKSFVLVYRFKYKFNLFKPVIWNVRNSNFRFFQFYQKIGLLFFGIFSRLFNPKIIYCSYKSKDVHELYFFSKKNSIVIQNRLAKKYSHTKNKIKLPKKFILFVGRYNKQKGVNRLLRISKKILFKNEDFKLIIAGYGWIKENIPVSIRNKVELLGDVKNIFSLYKKSKCLLFTSISGEGYPNVIPEAMVSGTPIIAFEAGDSKLIIDNYKFGITVNNETSFETELEKFMKKKYTKSEIELEIKKQKQNLNFQKTLEEYKKFIF